MEQNKFDIKKVKVHRTTSGTVLEIAFVLTALIVWGLIIWLVHQAPDIVPTHFDGSGNPNAYGSPVRVTIPCIIITIAAIGCMVVAYFPRYINVPAEIKNIRQVELTITFVRVVAITLLLMALAIAYISLGMSSPNALPVLAIVGLLLVEIIAFTVLIHKAK